MNLLDTMPDVGIQKISPSPETSARYQRQLSLDGFTPEHQNRLRNASVLVAGVGGLGGTAALYLAASGVGRLRLVHAGPLDLPDLNRQILMTPDWIGKSRVACAGEFLERFNPETTVEVVDARVHEGNAAALMEGIDAALSCRYNFEERAILNRACVETGVPMIEAAMYGMEAYLTVVFPEETACLACLYPEFPRWDPMGFPVLGAVSGTLGCLAAAETVKLLTGMGTSLRDRLLSFDLTDMTFKKLRTARRPGCPVCDHERKEPHGS